MTRDAGGAAGAAHQGRRSAGQEARRTAASARHVRAAADTLGRPGHRRRLQQQRRERHPVRAARRVRRAPDGGHFASGVRQAGEATAGADHRTDAGPERVPRRDEPDALVRELLRRQQPSVAGRRTGRREGAAADRRGAAAGTRAAAGARRPRPGRLLGGSQPLRSLHHPRHPRIDDAGHLRQLVPHPAGARASSPSPTRWCTTRA